MALMLFHQVVPAPTKKEARSLSKSFSSRPILSTGACCQAATAHLTRLLEGKRAPACFTKRLVRGSGMAGGETGRQAKVSD